MSPSAYFVLGNPRSGTSLFRSMLNAHPATVVPPECGFILWLADTWGTADWQAAGVLAAFADAVLASRKFETWELTKEQLLAELEPVKDYRDAVTRVVQAYARSKGRSVQCWGDKNNYYVTQVQALRKLFPDASYLHITRDVRDVACSYRELMQRSIDSKYKPVLAVDAEAIATEWVENNTNVIASLADHPGYLRLRYEDLVADVPGTMRTVFTKLGLPTEGLVGADMHLRSLDEPAEFLQWKAKLTAPADSASVGRYRTDLPAEEIAVIERVAGPLMVQLGYALSSGQA
jgi:hypothetical protein